MAEWTALAARVRAAPAGGREWHAALSAFHDPLDLLLHQLRSGEPDAVDAALTFLLEDPMCFRSGYAKENLLRTLARRELDDGQRARAQQLVLQHVRLGPSAGLAPHVARLAATIWAGDLPAAVARLAEPPATTIPRARRLLAQVDHLHAIAARRAGVRHTRAVPPEESAPPIRDD